MATTNPRALVPYFDLTTTVVNVGVTDVLLVSANADRVFLHISTAVGGNIFLRPDVAATPTQGILVSAGQAKQFVYRESGPLASREWHAIGSAPGIQTLVIETIFRPKR